MADPYEHMTRQQLIESLRSLQTECGPPSDHALREEADQESGKLQQARQRLEASHKQAEQEKQASAERLKLAHAAGGVGIWEYRFDTQELRWSEEKSRMFGLEPHPSSVSYETWGQLVHPDDRERIVYDLCGTQPECLDIEYRIIRPDGQVRWMASRGRTLHDEFGSKLIGVTIDITESKEIQLKLEELNEALAQRTREAEERSRQLRALAGELTQAENRERRRLALLLHDHLQQLLIALRMKVALVRSQPRSDRTELLLGQSIDLLDEAITASRSLSLELSPPMLYDSGLPAALGWLGRQVEEKYGLHVEIDANEGPEDYDIRMFLFQCVRELLFNVVKHANSPNAQVVIRRLEDNQISITVRDFGKGFDPSTLLKSQESFGLLSIRERLDWLGGRFEIHSTPNVGTEATLTAPTAKPTADAPLDQRSDSFAASAQNTGDPHGSPIRVLLVDDHAVVREGLTHLLEGEGDLKIVAQASDGETAVNQAKSDPVDIVVMDFSMPGMNGAEATRRIHDIKPDLPVIGMSIYEEQSIADSMRKAGAAAFFRKDNPSDELVATIRSLAAQPGPTQHSIPASA